MTLPHVTLVAIRHEEAVVIVASDITTVKTGTTDRR